MSHTCHAPGCNRLVPAKMFMCKPHWYSLPNKIRDAIWNEYERGQEISKRPSLRYLAVQRLACAYSVFKKDAADSIPYLLDAEKYRRQAIEAGLGDPLEDLVTDGDEVLDKARRLKAGDGD